MDNKIALTELAPIIAERTGQPRERVQKTLSGIFSLLGAELTRNESVKVKGLGTFRVTTVDARETRDLNSGERTTIGAYRRLSFTPDKRLSELVNAPFSMFESIELPESLSEEEISQLTPEEGEAILPDETPKEEEAAQAGEAAPSEETEKEDESAKEETPAPVVPIEMPEIEWNDDEPDTEAESASTAGDQAEEKPADEEPADEEDFEEEEDDDYSRRRGKSHFWPGVLAGVACTLLILGGLWAWRYFSPQSFTDVTGLVTTSTLAQSSRIVDANPATNPNIEPQPKELSAEETIEAQKAEEEAIAQDAAAAVADAAENRDAEVATQPSDSPVYDYISKKRFLTTMAKEHFGDYNLWPYIYEENKSILGHPDRIKPGTRIVIPPASKYGINASDKACIDRAKRMGAEIYARYK